MATSYKKKKKETVDKITPIVEEAIYDKLLKARTQGMIAGWYAYTLRVKEILEKQSTLEEAIEFFAKESETAAEKLGIDMSAIKDISTIDEAEDKNVE